MRFLRVVGWKDFQPYKNRHAPWIKAYTAILDPLEHPTFTNLTDGAKLTLHHLRLLAGVTGNQIPETWITSGHLNMHTKPKVEELTASGFVRWFDASELASEDVEQLASEHDSEDASELASEGLRARGRAPLRGRSHSQVLLVSPTEGTQKKQPRAGARELIENFIVTDSHRAWAAAKAPWVSDLDGATESWRDHFRTSGYKTRSGPIHDADASWRNWMKRELEFTKDPATKRGEYPKVATIVKPDIHD